MKAVFRFIALCLFIASCKPTSGNITSVNNDLIIAFGSCNNEDIENLLWKEVLKNEPSIWIWGGDNVYSDTDNMEILWQDYSQQLEIADYKTLQANTKILGTWDDHDYGLNDGGEEFHVKKESQQMFLDFMDVPKNDKRRQRDGVYHAEVINTEEGSVKVMVLDTRYFRTALTKSENPKKRYDPNPYGNGTILGEAQWEWLTNELKNSKSDFNIIVSSIQFLSQEHGFERWGTMPHEVDKLKSIISASNAKGVLLLSGDRHISEFSMTSIENLKYPLIDFTSSGLTHSYRDFKSEPNQFRHGEVVSSLSFGLLKFNFKAKTITMQMRGLNNNLQQELIQGY